MNIHQNITVKETINVASMIKCHVMNCILWMEQLCHDDIQNVYPDGKRCSNTPTGGTVQNQSCNHKINKHTVNQKMIFMFTGICALRAGGRTVFQIYFVLPKLRHHVVDMTLIAEPDFMF